MSGPVTVRPAVPADGETLVALIRGLAEYEKLTPPDEAGARRLIADLGVRYDCLLVEVDGRPVGYAVYFEAYSTFRGLPQLYLEDIFVQPEARSTGAGFALFRAVIREALRRGCDAVEWDVLDWNRLAIDFYERLGGRHQKEWLLYRLDSEALGRVAEG